MTQHICPACGHKFVEAGIDQDIVLCWATGCVEPAVFEGWHRVGNARLVKIPVCQLHKSLLIGWETPKEINT